MRCIRTFVPLLALLAAIAVTASASGRPHKPQFKFTTIDIEGSQRLDAFSLNDFGVVVGTFVDQDGIRHGYKLFNGRFDLIDHPDAANWTVCTGINNLGFIVGRYLDANHVGKSFVYRDKKFTPIEPPGSEYTIASGINDWGQIVGTYVDSSGVQHGFLFDGRRYITLDIDYPAATYTWAWSINNWGMITVQWGDADYNDHSSLYDGKKFREFIIPNSVYTDAGMINNWGEVVFTWYDENWVAHGALLSGGKYKFFDNPDGTDTLGYGLNDLGVIVGAYDKNGRPYGFLAIQK